MENKFLKELSNLDDLDILEISEKIEDRLVPVYIASKLKGVSRISIWNAIRAGKLRRVEGITMESLRKYKVDKKRKKNGLLNKERLEREEKERLDEIKEFEEGDN